MSVYKVVGVVNLTPDSYVSGQKNRLTNELIDEAIRMVQEGAYGLDFGAVATHLGAVPVSEDEEWQRLNAVLPIVRRLLPDIPFSVDTYRASIAERVIGEFGVEAINDISGGQWDKRMFDVVAEKRVTYIMGHTQGTIDNPTAGGTYNDLMADLIDYFVRKLDTLHRAGVSKLIIDPGFGFSKTLEQNVYLLHHLHYLRCLETPIMVGVSRKRMIYEPLHVLPSSEEALQGSLEAERLAIAQGVSYLRVHDVKQTVEL